MKRARVGVPLQRGGEEDESRAAPRLHLQAEPWEARRAGAVPRDVGEVDQNRADARAAQQRDARTASVVIVRGEELPRAVPRNVNWLEQFGATRRQLLHAPDERRTRRLRGSEEGGVARARQG